MKSPLPAVPRSLIQWLFSLCYSSRLHSIPKPRYVVFVIYSTINRRIGSVSFFGCVVLSCKSRGERNNNNTARIKITGYGRGNKEVSTGAVILSRHISSCNCVNYEKNFQNERIHKYTNFERGKMHFFPHFFKDIYIYISFSLCWNRFWIFEMK